MDARKNERWTLANGKDTILNGMLAAALALLILHAASGGTVEVPAPNHAGTVVDEAPVADFPYA